MRIEDLSALSGVHRSQISRIERGIAVTLTPTARGLCECLGIPLPIDAGQGKAVLLSARVAALVHAYPDASEHVLRALEDIERQFGPVSPKDRRKRSKAP
ncbi:helix-turn-helix domain-containing protein [Luteibacter aegosomatissinici]|uniref:helix-turn-helix domain-containing protein n=1 Tax=Luteibacter aegosomatissinici TaxID=2911539 RepID=UPI001FF9D84B|nr:helix-turn-helix transcriptional regulator [Luteibacter aegosomatissinici]UPG96285.1 helix-turn-helix transcriptional regulator [Luteibacter aegosomatissinici]